MIVVNDEKMIGLSLYGNMVFFREKFIECWECSKDVDYLMW